MNTATYLSRLGINSPKVDYTFLSLLQRKHLFSIPFENLEFRQEKRKMDMESMYKKIVVDQRGGVCIELNGCLHWLLQQIGFTANIISGFVRKSEFDHMMILVKLDQEYLVDVGFGDFFFRSPVPLTGEVTQDVSGQYRVTKSKVMSKAYVLQKKEKGHWQDKYHFTNAYRNLEDFEFSWRWFLDSPNPFRENDICRIDTNEGNISLYNNTLTVIKNGEKKVSSVPTTKKEDVLKRYFGIEFGHSKSVHFQ